MLLCHIINFVGNLKKFPLLTKDGVFNFYLWKDGRLFVPVVNVIGKVVKFIRETNTITNGVESTTTIFNTITTGQENKWDFASFPTWNSIKFRIPKAGNVSFLVKTTKQIYEDKVVGLWEYL